MPKLHVDEDGAIIITIEPAEVLRTLAVTKSSLLLAALKERLEPVNDAIATIPKAPARKKHGKTGGKKGRPNKGTFAERFRAVLEGHGWVGVEDLTRALDRTSLTGSCAQALRDAVKEGLMEVEGSGEERRWRWAK